MKNLFFVNSSFGDIGIADNGKAITDIFFKKDKKNIGDFCIKETSLIKRAALELSEYFNGARKTFSVPIALEGTTFQKKVWNALLNIKYGETKSYEEIAKEIDNKKACRAVGNANNKNPLCIIVPCHRVIGKNKKLTGYAGGIEIKKILLELEKQ